MLGPVRTYLYDRRKDLSIIAFCVGGLYIAKRYFNDRLEEVKDGMEQERSARERYVFGLILN